MKPLPTYTEKNSSICLPFFGECCKQAGKTFFCLLEAISSLGSSLVADYCFSSTTNPREARLLEDLPEVTEIFIETLGDASVNSSTPLLGKEDYVANIDRTLQLFHMPSAEKNELRKQLINEFDNNSSIQEMTQSDQQTHITKKVLEFSYAFLMKSFGSQSKEKLEADENE